jgi:hypothetical protein
MKKQNNNTNAAVAQKTNTNTNARGKEVKMTPAQVRKSLPESFTLTAMHNRLAALERKIEGMKSASATEELKAAQVFVDAVKTSLNSHSEYKWSVEVEVTGWGEVVVKGITNQARNVFAGFGIETEDAFVFEFQPSWSMKVNGKNGLQYTPKWNRTPSISHMTDTNGISFDVLRKWTNAVQAIGDAMRVLMSKNVQEAAKTWAVNKSKIGSEGVGSLSSEWADKRELEHGIQYMTECLYILDRYDINPRRAKKPVIKEAAEACGYTFGEVREHKKGYKELLPALKWEGFKIPVVVDEDESEDNE